MKRVTTFFCLFIFFVIPAAGQAQQSCDADRKHDFDFWIGTWDVTVGGKQAGKNIIEPVMDGCALMENWTNMAGIEGKSINFYNPTIGKWQQNWVSQNGIPLHLVGGIEDGKMILEGETKDPAGNAVQNRITWFNNEDGTVRQLWETTSDQGATWAVAFDGLYTRVEG